MLECSRNIILEVMISELELTVILEVASSSRTGTEIGTVIAKK